MQEKKNHGNTYNRREFIAACGILVASSAISCGARKEKPQEILTNRTIPPTNIRVRIGKNAKAVTIGGTLFTHKNINGTSKTIEIRPGTKISIGNKTKLITGTIQLFVHEKHSQSNFDVVAHVPIDKYIPGVISGELYSHWHQTTFTAQAVAARSYAIAQNIERKKTSHYDLDDGPSSQMFVGDVTLDVAHRASEESAGVVLTWDNRVIPTYYSACCGGVAATALDAISGAKSHNIPPLMGREGRDVCQSLDIHSWSVVRLSRNIRHRLNLCGAKQRVQELIDIRSIRSIEPTKTNKHGRPTDLTIYDRKNVPVEMKAKDFIRAVNLNTPSLPSPTPTIWSSNLVAKKDGPNIKFDGTGMGHGVGLCQYGAQELANKGMSWEEILAWYYPEAIIS